MGSRGDREDAGGRSEDEILQDALGEVGARGGGLGGLAGGGQAGALGGRSGGRAGARFTARFLGNDEYEITRRVPASAEGVAQVEQALRSVSEVVERLPDEGGVVTFRTVVGAGCLSMNPAVVTVRVGADGRVVVRGVAKEGLIKQRAGRAAAERVGDELDNPTFR